MIYRSTCVRLTATARQCWSPLLHPVLRQPRAAFWGLRVSHWPTRGIRYAAEFDEPYDEPDIPVQQAAQARIGLSKLPSDRASLSDAVDLKHIEAEAWDNDGKHALDVLDRLCLEPHDDQAIPKAIICLQAYKYSIEHLSVEDAKVVLANDEAGNRVVHWFETEAINQQIRYNHPGNTTLLSLVSDILVGAGRLQKIESWLTKPNPKELYGAKDRRGFNVWKGSLYASVLTSLTWWHPQGAIDNALDYFSETCEPMIRFEAGHFISYIPLLIITQRLMTNPGLLCIDSDCFDRGLAAMRRLILLVRDFGPHNFLSMTLAKLLHPSHPDPDPFLNYMREVDEDPFHMARFYASKGFKLKTYGLYSSMFRCCAKALWREGRARDALWSERAFRRIFGRDSGFLEAEDPLSREARRRWLDQFAKRHYPDHYKGTYVDGWESKHYPDQ